MEQTSLTGGVQGTGTGRHRGQETGLGRKQSVGLQEVGWRRGSSKAGLEQAGLEPRVLEGVMEVLSFMLMGFALRARSDRPILPPPISSIPYFKQTSRRAVLKV
ncbi:hypothetical protein NDU88_005013 [Pleurodeles waltl]|uniref:Uncharacterized protein n=1 Tax=Pleurodeles waltl TaxID=8319 RepID=A0AAV7WZY2_PLEWA|nr:hypothetical protein NDU88_005013 [Pleurodeles waltl]